MSSSDGGKRQRFVEHGVSEANSVTRVLTKGPRVTIQKLRKELKATTILSLPLTEASAKIRTGPPTDDLDDRALAVWAGVIPLELKPAPPIADADVDLPSPRYASEYHRLT